MTLLALFLFAAVLGVTFRVWVLIPMSLIVVVICAAWAVLHHSFMSQAALRIALAIACLQVGYLLGVLVRAIVVSKDTIGSDNDHLPANAATVSPFHQAISATTMEPARRKRRG